MPPASVPSSVKWEMRRLPCEDGCGRDVVQRDQHRPSASGGEDAGLDVTAAS